MQAARRQGAADTPVAVAYHLGLQVERMQTQLYAAAAAVGVLELAETAAVAATAAVVGR